MTLGERLKEIRTMVGLSIEEVVGKAKLTSKQILNYEEDIHKPRPKTIAILAKVYGVLPSDLTDLSKQIEFVVDKQNTPMIEELMKAYTILTQLGYYVKVENNIVYVYEVDNPNNTIEINKKEFENWLLDIIESWKVSVAEHLKNSCKSKAHLDNVALQKGEAELFKYCGVDKNE